MGVTLTTRISEELNQLVEDISEEEKLDKSAVARRLLEEASRDYRIEKALEKYQEGVFSLGKAAEYAGVSIREFLEQMKQRDIHFNYSEQSLEEDFEAVKNE